MNKFCWVFLILCSFWSCNKDEVIEADVPAPRPEISFDQSLYSVKVGHELHFEPTITNAEDAIFTWYLDEQKVGDRESLTYKFDEVGSFELVLRVEAPQGNASEAVEVEVSAVTPPRIQFPDNITRYEVKVGEMLKVTPLVQFDADVPTEEEGAEYTWLMGDEIVGKELTLNHVFDAEGEYFLTFRVKTPQSVAEGEILAVVAPLQVPQIALNLPEGGINIMVNTDYVLEPTFTNADMEGFEVEWFVDDEKVSTANCYVFNRADAKVYNVKIVARNIDGESALEFPINVVAELPVTISYDKLYAGQETPSRSTFVGRPILLQPRMSGFKNPVYAWFVNGEKVADATAPEFEFVPSAAGDYEVTIEVRTELAAGGTIDVPHTIHVFVPEQSEEAMLREKTGASNKNLDKVFEFTPAPGQFIGDQRTGGFTGAETTPQSAVAYAAARLRAGENNPNSDATFVSLGGFGGLIIVGFDHSVVNTGTDYDFSIGGNAFEGSSEAGVVWVMQDVNGNGLPDDEWYELRGSETGNPDTIQDYAVTYFRPSAPKMDVHWEDNLGNKGVVPYNNFHPQDFYYPAWITTDSYTLRGTRLPAANRLDPQTGYWSNEAYGWGYADNFGSDNLNNDDGYSGKGQRNGFKIANAIDRKGRPVDLKYIDFVKVQNGINASSGNLGEISTEVFGFTDLTM